MYAHASFAAARAAWHVHASMYVRTKHLDMFDSFFGFWRTRQPGSNYRKPFASLLSKLWPMSKHLACITSNLAGQQHTRKLLHCVDAKLADGLLQL